MLPKPPVVPVPNPVEVPPAGWPNKPPAAVLVVVDAQKRPPVVAAGFAKLDVPKPIKILGKTYITITTYNI